MKNTVYSKINSINFERVRPTESEGLVGSITPRSYPLAVAFIGNLISPQTRGRIVETIPTYFQFHERPQ